MSQISYKSHHDVTINTSTVLQKGSGKYFFGLILFESVCVITCVSITFYSNTEEDILVDIIIHCTLLCRQELYFVVDIVQHELYFSLNLTTFITKGVDEIKHVFVQLQPLHRKHLITTVLFHFVSQLKDFPTLSMWQSRCRQI